MSQSQRQTTAKRPVRGTRLLIALLLCTLLPTYASPPRPTAAATIVYRIIALPFVAGEQNTQALGGINNSGQVSGIVRRSDNQARAVRYEIDGSLTEFNSLPGGLGSIPFGIAEDGRIVGAAYTLIGTESPSTQVHPFVSNGSDLVDLCPDSQRNGYANAINDQGDVVGAGCGDYTQATLFTGGTSITLGVLRDCSWSMSGCFSVAAGINNKGQIVGNSNTGGPGYSGDLYHAFLYQNGTMTDLGPIFGSTGQSYAGDINDAGQIAGSATPTGGSSRAFIYDTRDDSVIDLGVLPDATASGAMAINASGHVVGSSGDKPFLYRDGAMLDLNTLLPANSGWVLNEALGINDRGQIIGRGTYNGQEFTPFLLSPVTLYDLSLQAGSGGTITPPATPGPYEAGSPVTLTAQPDTGYELSGWTLDGINAGSASTLAVTMNDDHSVVATFTQLPPAPTPSPSASPAPSPSAPTLTIAPVTATQGSVTVSRDGDRATLVAQPAAVQRFLGWQIGGANIARIGTAPAITTWANPLTLLLTDDLTVTPVFAAQQPFPDVAANDPANGALAELATRGIIRGYESGAVGPDDPILRAQMAALIARTLGYTDLPGNPFTDRCDPGQPANCIDGELWQAVSQLATREIARGYSDLATCAPAAAPCYAPRDAVVRIQVIAFITRAMIDAGYWQQQPADPHFAGGALNGTGHEADIATYRFYTGNTGDFTAPLNALSGTDWQQPATRAWFARALWTALDSQFGGGVQR